MNKIFLALTLLFVLVGCSNMEPTQTDTAKAVVACEAQNGSATVSKEDVFVLSEVDTVKCKLPNGTETHYYSRNGVFVVDNDATDVESNCTLKMGSLVKNDEGAYICLPKTPHTLSKFKGWES